MSADDTTAAEATNETTTQAQPARRTWRDRARSSGRAVTGRRARFAGAGLALLLLGGVGGFAVGSHGDGHGSHGHDVADRRSSEHQRARR